MIISCHFLCRKTQFHIRKSYKCQFLEFSLKSIENNLVIRRTQNITIIEIRRVYLVRKSQFTYTLLNYLLKLGDKKQVPSN